MNSQWVTDWSCIYLSFAAKASTSRFRMLVNTTIRHAETWNSKRIGLGECLRTERVGAGQLKAVQGETSNDNLDPNSAAVIFHKYNMMRFSGSPAASPSRVASDRLLRRAVVQQSFDGGLFHATRFVSHTLPWQAWAILGFDMRAPTDPRHQTKTSPAGDCCRPSAEAAGPGECTERVIQGAYP